MNCKLYSLKKRCGGSSKLQTLSHDSSSIKIEVYSNGLTCYWSCFFFIYSTLLTSIYIIQWVLATPTLMARGSMNIINIWLLLDLLNSKPCQSGRWAIICLQPNCNLDDGWPVLSWVKFNIQFLSTLVLELISNVTHCRFCHGNLKCCMLYSVASRYTTI